MIRYSYFRRLFRVVISCRGFDFEGVSDERWGSIVELGRFDKRMTSGGNVVSVARRAPRSFDFLVYTYIEVYTNT